MRKIGLDVRKDRILIQVIADHYWHEVIGHFVVGYPRTDSIGQADIASSVGVDNSRNSQHRIGPENLGIQKVVIDPALHCWHARYPSRGFHVDLAVLSQ